MADNENTQIQILNYCNEPIRMIEIDNEPWWVLKDICDVLGIANPTQTAARLDEDERAMFDIGRQGQTNIINEAGLYNVILRSDKPEAKPFRKWVTHEVLPSIRKTGAYSVPNAKPKPPKPERVPLTDAEAAIKKAELLLKAAQSDDISKTVSAELMASFYETLTGESFSQKAYESLLNYDGSDFGEAYVRFRDNIMSHLHNFRNNKWGKIDGEQVCFIKTVFDEQCKKDNIEPKQFVRWLDSKGHIVKDRQGQFTVPIYIVSKTTRCVVLKMNFSDNE